MQIVGLTVRKGRRGDTYKFKMDLYRHGRYQRTVYKTLGRTDQMTREAAQIEAAKLADAVRRGIDPTRQIDAPTLTVRGLFEHYVADLTERGCKPRFREGMMRRAERYLPGWLDTPFVQITKDDCRRAHKRITREHGARAADQMISNFHTAWRIAQQTLDGDIPSNIPTTAVRRNGDNEADYSDWTWEEFKERLTVAMPMTRIGLLFTLYSGLRKANVLGMRKDWVQADRIVVPRDEMKVTDPRRGPFLVPLTEPMQRLLAEANAFGVPDSPFVFNRDGKPLATLRGGAHALRHIHFTEGLNAGIELETLLLLHDHSMRGMAKVYTSRRHVDFSVLADAQNRISRRLELQLDTQ